MAREKATQLHDAVEMGKSTWQKSQEAMAKFYNRHRKGRSYAIGDEVMLSSRNIRMRKASKKLADKFLGPFRVIAIRGKNAYELELPKSYGRIHLTFHVALLEPYQRREGVELPEAVEIEGEAEWEVERILDTRVKRKKRMYLVRWKGYTRDNDS
jgi:Chromo (CHRromatin Organisation MOdifier) domain